MRKWVLVTAALVLVAAAAWWWPTDRRRIIAASRELTEAVSIPASEPELARVTRAARLSRLLAPDFRLVDAGGRTAVDGRDAAIGLATRLQPPRGLQVSAGELDLVIADGGRTAQAKTVVTLREPGGESGADETVDTRPILLDWVNEGGWTLSTATLQNGG